MISPTLQREAETVLRHARRLVAHHGSTMPFEIGDRMRLRITPNYSAEANTISIRNLAIDETMLIGTWRDDDIDRWPPVFVTFADQLGFWREIVRQSAEQLQPQI